METSRGRVSWVTVSLLALILCFLLASLGYRPKERMIPLVIGIPTLLIGLVVLAGERYPRIMKKFEVSLEDLVSEKAREPGTTPAPRPRILTRQAAAICAWGTGFFVAVYLVGFYIAIPAFLLPFLRFQGNISWGKTVAFTVGTGLFIYLLFNVCLGEELFAGILFGSYVPPL